MTTDDLKARAARLCEADVRAAWDRACAADRDYALGDDDESPEQAVEGVIGTQLAIFGALGDRLVLAEISGRLAIVGFGEDGPRAVDLDDRAGR